MCSIYKKLAAIQSKLEAPKNQFNKLVIIIIEVVNILLGLKPILKEQGCSLILSDEVVLIGDRYYIKATALLVDLEDEKACVLIHLCKRRRNKNYGCCTDYGFN